MELHAVDAQDGLTHKASVPCPLGNARRLPYLEVPLPYSH